MQIDHHQARRILLVEDDAELREALSDALSDRGHTVVMAADGEDGLRQMRTWRPDVVVLDLMMPKLDGWQFRLAQREDPGLARTPIVVMSASSSPSAAAVDADLYLRKPLDADTLLHAIDDVINANKRRLQPAAAAQTERLAALGTLAAGLAHEINNPLTYLLLRLAQVERLLPALTTEENRAQVQQIAALVRSSLDGADRIRGITTGIRAFSRSEPTVIAPVDVRGCLDGALRLVANELRHRARLTTTYIDPPLVLANEGQLGQVFLNLLANAFQAIPEGSAQDHQVTVTAGANAAGDLVVEISDTGEGIEPHVRARIFEPFFSTKPIGQGTGLGLSISHHIIAGFGGDITVESEVGHGTKFRVVIPAMKAASWNPTSTS